MIGCFSSINPNYNKDVEKFNNLSLTQVIGTFENSKTCITTAKLE